jgi:ribosomal protein S6
MSDELRDKAITLEIRKNNEGKTIINSVRANGSKQDTLNTSLKIFHQNIRGLRIELNKLHCHVYFNPPHIMCLSEHHL